MGTVVLDISTSLDGYVAGPDDGLGKGLGEGGEPIHYWVFGGWTYSDISDHLLGSPAADVGAQACAGHVTR
ncbi:MAG: hypothetical protein ACRDTM_09315 [Micromonosporaceae bacterium]